MVCGQHGPMLKLLFCSPPYSSQYGPRCTHRQCARPQSFSQVAPTNIGATRWAGGPTTCQTPYPPCLSTACQHPYPLPLTPMLIAGSGGPHAVGGNQTEMCALWHMAWVPLHFTTMLPLTRSHLPSLTGMPNGPALYVCVKWGMMRWVSSEGTSPSP